MTDLKKLCEDAGCTDVRTYIASGNVVLRSAMTESRLRSALEKKLHAYAGKQVGLMIRTASEMKSIVKRNPFPKGAPNRVIAIFRDKPPPRDTLATVSGRKDEELALGKREIYVHYGDGMGASKLKIPAAKDGTARNMNTVSKLAAMAEEL
jgi:uncharacterized protein (DUF1697 family)